MTLIISVSFYLIVGRYIHSIRIHRFASVEVEVTEVWCDLCSIVVLDLLLEGLDLLLVCAALLEFFHHFFQIACARTY